MKKAIILMFLALAVLALVVCTAEEAECNHVLINCVSAGSGSHTGTCKLCGAIVSEAHSLETRRVPATCVSPAIVSYVCTKCGYETESYTEGGVGTEHKWGSYVTTKEPTCTTTGEATRTCSLCGATETITLALSDHQYGAWTPAGENLHVKTCVNCGATVTENHNSTVARTVTYAQDARLGKKSYTCSACGYMYTRYYSASNSKLYTTETTDLAGWILVDTINGEAGGTYAVRTYPDAVFMLEAVTDCQLKVYADASSLEYLGICLVTGSASLTYQSGSAALDFISCGFGAELTVDTAGGMVTVGGSAFSKAADGSLVFNYTDGNTAFMSVSSGGTATFSESGTAGTGSLLLTARSVYNSETQKLSVNVSDSSYGLSVYASDTCVFTGSNAAEYNCSLTAAQAAAGWYLSLTGKHTYNSAALDADYKPVGAAGVAEPESTVPETTEEPESVEPAAGVPETITVSSSIETQVHLSPDIYVRINDGTYSVEVTNLPEGWLVTCVRFVQTYTAGGLKLVNVYGVDSAEYQLNVYAGKVFAEVFLTDSTGDPIQYAAGSFTLAEY